MQEEDPDYQLLINTEGCKQTVPTAITRFYLVPIFLAALVQCFVFIIQIILIRLIATANHFAAKNVLKKSKYKVVSGFDSMPAHLFVEYNDKSLKKWHKNYVE